MSAEVVEIIQGLVDAETKGWDEKDIEPFLAMIHPDMAWPFAPNADAHDPIDWLFVLRRFDEEAWRKGYNELFAAHDLIHNRRTTAKIEVAPTGDAAFAVVDIDTLWRNKGTGADFHWKGRVCKIYSKLRTGEWKFYWQTSALNFPSNPEAAKIGTRMGLRVFLSMSARALKFLNRWMADHLPNVSTDDPGTIADLVVELLASAGRQGIAPKEIYEEVDSVFRLVSEAMQHRGGGLAG